MSDPSELIRPPAPRHRWHHAAGLVLLAANAVRHRLMGYRTPRPMLSPDVGSALGYDRAVFDSWHRHLADYVRRDFDPRGRHVLELGPGPDLGTGLLWLCAGAASYTAVDAHRLVGGGKRRLHEGIARELAARCAEDGLGPRLLDAVARLHAGDETGPLRYRVLSGFDLSRLPERSFDLVVGHSSFEHLADARRTLGQLSSLATDRAHLVAEIDLQTHTRWIRDADPLNIYRYGRRLYRGFGFSGMPNRVRPEEYVEALERGGWCDFRLYPRRVLDPAYVKAVAPQLDRRFRGDLEHLGWLSVVICASRRGERSWKTAQGRRCA